MTRPSRESTSYSIGIRVASTISSRSSVETSIVMHVRGSAAATESSRYSVRSETWPRVRASCTTPLGTHSARCGGTTNVASRVVHTSTPLIA